MKCNIITPKTAMGPTVKALADGHRADECLQCEALQYASSKGADQKAAGWPPGRHGDVEEGSA